MIDEVRAKITPVFDDVQKAVQAFTAVAQRATDPAGPLEQTLASAAGIARKVESGEGLAGRLISDDKLSADLEATLVSVRELAAQLERTSKDPRITQILVKTNSILTSLQATTRNLAATTPQITRSVQDTTDAMPATLLQAQIAARELELLLGQLRHHWLFGGSSAPAQPEPSRARGRGAAVIRQPLSLLSVLALAACGGGGPVDTGPPPDVKLDQANTAGTQALSMDLPSLAVRQYKVALSRAYERDDAGAIGDVAYNLALAQMKAGDSKGAVATVREARAELDRRRAAVPPELILVQAAAAYRSGDLGAQPAPPRKCSTAAAKDPDAVRRAWFIRGLVAADRSDAAGLAQAIAALPPTKQADLEADRQELQGRAALLANDPAGALSLFEQSASNRQQALDYRGMARALSLAGDAALRSGRAADAADLFLRAGRSALLQGDTATATASAEARRGPRQADRPDRHRRGGGAAAQSGGRADDQDVSR